MRILRSKFLVLAALTLALGGCGDVNAPPPAERGAKPLVVGTDAAFPPMEFTEDDGSIVGFDIDLIDAVGREIGRPAEVRNMAWSGIFGALDTGTVDLVASSVTITPERSKTFLFTDPYLNAGQLLVVRAEDRERYGSLDDLAGRRIGAQAGTTGHIRLDREQGLGEIVAYESSPLAMMDLVHGSVDAVLIDGPVAEYYAARKPELAGKLAVVGDAYTEEQFGFVARPTDTALVEEINAALARIRASGEYDRIREKWFGPHDLGGATAP